MAVCLMVRSVALFELVDCVVVCLSACLVSSLMVYIIDMLVDLVLVCPAVRLHAWSGGRLVD